MRLQSLKRSALREPHSCIPAFSAALLLAVSISGCRVHTVKGPNGEDKQVQVDTPFGGIHVNTGQTTATDLGLPVYPGAQLITDRDNDKSADVHMGFGKWELHVQAVNYASSDSQDKIVAFYKKALGRYGDVIACQDNAPVGTPASTSRGLTCNDKGKSGTNVQVNGDSLSSQGGYELKAGSPHRQHIVAFKSAAPGQTRFSLVAVELPNTDSASTSD